MQSISLQTLKDLILLRKYSLLSPFLYRPSVFLDWWSQSRYAGLHHLSVHILDPHRLKRVQSWEYQPPSVGLCSVQEQIVLQLTHNNHIIRTLQNVARLEVEHSLL